MTDDTDTECIIDTISTGQEYFINTKQTCPSACAVHQQQIQNMQE